MSTYQLDVVDSMHSVLGCSYHIPAGALPDFAQVLLLHMRAHASFGHYLSQMVLSISGFPYGLSQLGCYEDLFSCNTTFQECITNLFLVAVSTRRVDMTVALL
jgi:hypothetical protein